MNRIGLARSLALLRLDAQTRLGLAGFVGAALLAGAATTAWLAPRMHDEARDLQVQIEAARQRMADPAARRLPLDAAAQAAEFRAWFPPVSQTHEDLRALFRLAGEHRLTLARGEYAAAVRRDAQLSTYDVVLPVRAAYPAVRGFVAAVLNALPHASLAELRLERGTSTADMVDARVHLTLYYRAAEGGETP
jgi:hypothetical protein